MIFAKLFTISDANQVLVSKEMQPTHDGFPLWICTIKHDHKFGQIEWFKTDDQRNEIFDTFAHREALLYYMGCDITNPPDWFRTAITGAYMSERINEKS